MNRGLYSLWSSSLILLIYDLYGWLGMSCIIMITMGTVSQICSSPKLSQILWQIQRIMFRCQRFKCTVHAHTANTHMYAHTHTHTHTHTHKNMRMHAYMHAHAHSTNTPTHLCITVACNSFDCKCYWCKQGIVNFLAGLFWLFPSRPVVKSICLKSSGNPLDPRSVVARR